MCGVVSPGEGLVAESEAGEGSGWVHGQRGRHEGPQIAEGVRGRDCICAYMCDINRHRRRNVTGLVVIVVVMARIQKI